MTIIIAQCIIFYWGQNLQTIQTFWFVRLGEGEVYKNIVWKLQKWTAGGGDGDRKHRPAHSDNTIDSRDETRWDSITDHWRAAAKQTSSMCIGYVRSFYRNTVDCTKNCFKKTLCTCVWFVLVISNQHHQSISPVYCTTVTMYISWSSERHDAWQWRKLVITARCTLVQSAVLRSHVVCLSVRLSVCL